MNRRDSLKLLAAATGGVVLASGNKRRALTTSVAASSPLPSFETQTAAYTVAPALTWLRFGDIKPRGWLKDQMLRDLTTGYAGHLDQLCPDAGSDSFVAGQSSELIAKSGRKPHPAFWFGETEGNWRAGLMMLACLSEDPATMRKVEEYVQHLLVAQAPDGYIGVFKQELRYKTPGDLWSQACLLRGVLAYAECTRNPEAFHGVVRAVDAILNAHAEPNGLALKWSQSHDVMICDVLERLYDITGEAKYRDFALRCYEGWSAVAHDSRDQGDDDASLGSLDDPNHLYFLGHSVHTVEHLRVPVWLAAATGRADYVTAAKAAMDRSQRYLFSTGAIVGNGVGGTPTHRFNEAINNSLPDPYEGEWEYCTARETQVTFLSAMQKTGRSEHAERVERVFLNAAQGGRLPDGSALTYMTAENRFCCDGHTQDGHEVELRNIFSPTAEDVAICCNPNGTQVSSHYTRGMWMRHRDGGLAAMLYGPASVSTEIAGTHVTLDVQTNYPFEHTIAVTVQPQRSAQFNLHFRNPAWSPNTTVQCEGATITREGDFWTVSKPWRRGDIVHLQFTPQVQQVVASNGEIALQYGALLFALPIAANAKIVKTYAVAGFHDTFFTPAEPYRATLAFPAGKSKDLGFTAAAETSGNALRPFEFPTLKLQGTMTNIDTRAKAEVTLVPFGSTQLRQLTFPQQT